VSSGIGGEVGDGLKTGTGDHVLLETVMVGPPAVGRIAHSSVLRDLIELTKPRIVIMILVTTVVAAVVAAGGAIEPSLIVHLMMGTGLVAASAGVLNQVLERDVDLRMPRTARRPIPSGRFSPLLAVIYGVVLVLVGSIWLSAKVSWTTTLLGLLTWVIYLALYTPLKLRTSFNTTVGAIAGALPMMMGYTGTGGSVADGSAWLLLGILVAWQYPHFMAIAWLYRQQYEDAGFKMTTVVEPTGRSAGWQAVIGAILAPCFLSGLVLDGEYGFLWVVACGLISWSLIRAAWRFAVRPDEALARKLLWASLSQLPLSMLLLVVYSFWSR
jgi:protoheme IX farnesyltransferase